MRVKVTLLGYLGEKFGINHEYEVDHLRDVLRGLAVNYPDFISALESLTYQGYDFEVLAGNEYLGEEELAIIKASGVYDSVCIAPVIQGAGTFGRIIAGIALIGLALAVPGGILGISATTIGLLGGTLVLGGISQLLTPNKNKKSEEDTRLESGVFTNPANSDRQGAPVPLVYGTFLVAPQIVSAGISLTGTVGDIRFN